MRFKLVSLSQFIVPPGVILVTARSVSEMIRMFGFKDDLSDVNGKDVVVLPSGYCGWAQALIDAGARSVLMVDREYEPGFSVVGIQTKFFFFFVLVAKSLEMPGTPLSQVFKANFTTIANGREASQGQFAQDFDHHRDRYLCDALPEIPNLKSRFSTQKADLLLSSFLLFFYDQVDPIASILSMLEIAHEVRIHPLIEPSGVLSHKLNSEVIPELKARGYECRLLQTNYDTYRSDDAKQTLIVSRPSAHHL